MAAESEPYSEADIRVRASCIADGTAKPDWALELLAEFVRQVDRRTVSHEMLEYLCDGFRAYLAGNRLFYAAPEEGRPRAKRVEGLSLEKALGVVRPFVGRYRIDADVAAEIAAEILHERLAGATFEGAVRTVSTKRHKSKSQIEQCWTRAWHPGYIHYRICRHLEGSGWTDPELRRLEKIFKGKPGFSPPVFHQQKPG